MWKHSDTDKQVTRRQAVRRHAQRRHHYFYQSRLDGNFMQNFAAAPIRWSGERWVISAVAFLLGLLTFVVLPSWASIFGNQTPNSLTQQLQLSLPPAPPVEESQAAPDKRMVVISGNIIPIAESNNWIAIKVEPGHSLGQMFSNEGFSSAQLMDVLGRMKNAASLTQLRPGEIIGVRRDIDGRFTGIQFDGDGGDRVLVNVASDGRVNEQLLTSATEKRIRAASGVIRGSLFAAADEAGLSDAAILQMAKIFSYDIDFAQDLRSGDHFSVVYQELFRDGEQIAGGDILAAVFVNRGKRFDALRFTRPGSTVPEYFDSSGRSLRKAFIRTPVEFTRISSRFASARRHPILGTIRAHRGVDYAAPAGTPIIAAADGRIASAGWQNGYGNAVVISHDRGYSTLYGHMSRFSNAAKRGNRVSQGTVIGYVGKTGLATAPHLHYEFRVGGVHRDPLKVTMPPPLPLASGLLASFQQATRPYLTQLAMAESRLAVAAR